MKIYVSKGRKKQQQHKKKRKKKEHGEMVKIHCYMTMSF